MDFGHILDEWETIKREHKDSGPPPQAANGEAHGKPAAPGKPAVSRKPAATAALEAWLAANGVGDKDADGDPAAGIAPGGPERSRESRRLSALRPEAVLDLHGMTAEEAESAIAAFVDESSRAGLEKVLVIHGKGLHSAGAPVLKKSARRALERHPLAGRFGEADKADGGSGALWVLVRKRG